VPVNLSIKNVPDDLADALRVRAAANHRSLQGELLAILEHELRTSPRKTLAEFVREAEARGFKTRSNSVRIVREDRDKR